MRTPNTEKEILFVEAIYWYVEHGQTDRAVDKLRQYLEDIKEQSTEAPSDDLEKALDFIAFIRSLMMSDHMLVDSYGNEPAERISSEFTQRAIAMNELLAKHNYK